MPMQAIVWLVAKWIRSKAAMRKFKMKYMYKPLYTLENNVYDVCMQQYVCAIRRQVAISWNTSCDK